MKAKPSMPNDRKLGVVEQAMELLNQRACTWNIITISRITSSPKFSLNEKIFKQAISLTQQRHPRLRAQIVDTLKKPKFKTLDNLEIPVRMSWKKPWQEVVQEELNTKIDVKNGLLRVVLAADTDQPNVTYLITTTHHAISDARSCVQLHAEMLGYCSDIVQRKPCDSVTSLLPLPPVEDLLPYEYRGWKKGLGKVVKGIISKVYLLAKLGFQEAFQRPKHLSVEKDVSVSKRRASFIHVSMDEQFSQKLVNRCRAEDTTVHGALCAALMLTVAREVTGRKQEKVHLSCQSYLDLRKKLDYVIKDEHMAVLAAAIRFMHSVSGSTPFWEIAREVKSKLRHVKPSDIFDLLVMTKFFMKLFLAIPQKILASVSVSNIGRVSIPETYGPFNLEEISFLGSNSLFAGILAVNASSFREQIFLNFAFSEPSLSRERMETLVERILVNLRAAVD